MISNNIISSGSSSGIPSGIVCMWSGTSNNIPNGWLLCDGNNGTPDLRDRFIVGAGKDYNVGNTGGEVNHILTINEMPSHNHTLNLSGLTTNETGGHTHAIKNYSNENTFYMFMANGGVNASDGSTRIVTANINDSGSNRITSEGSHTHTITGSGTIESTGSGSSHENRPPYYALCFIMKQ